MIDPSLIQMVQTGGFVGLLIILAFPTLRAKFGFGNGALSTDVLAEALKKVLVEDDNSPILVKARISRVCDRIDNIDERISEMKQDMTIIKHAITK